MQETDTVLHSEKELLLSEVKEFNPDLIVSYRYRHILKKDILSIPRLGSVNLHTSFLPYNRGAEPHIWSQLDGTPQGISIHLIDEGIDTGPIIARKVIHTNGEMTIAEVYTTLQTELKELFKSYFELIKSGEYDTYKQVIVRKLHLLKDCPVYSHNSSVKMKDISDKKTD